jgi:hypothetical protein
MNPLWSRHRFGLAILLCATGVLGGCGPKPAHPAAKAPTPVGGYLTPPTIQSATREADGGVRLAGAAAQGASIGLHAPDGAQFEVHSGVDGAWSLDLPPASEPRLFAFDAKTETQTIRAEGALAIMPPPGVPALVLRAGYAAAPSGQTPGGPARAFLQLVSFDYDGGGAAAGGFAAPDSPVRLSIDGAIVGLSRADAQGRFAVLAIDPRRGVPAGAHTVRIETPQGLAIERRVIVAAPEIPPDKAFAARRTNDGWVLSWRLPGGGAQSSLVFDAASAVQPARSNPAEPQKATP